MDWQIPPLTAWVGLLLISIGLMVGFNIRLKPGADSERDQKL